MDEQYEQYKAMVEQALGAWFTDIGDETDLLRAAMRYSLLAGGKRLRPVLCLAFCELCGGDPEKALPVACGVEMLHTYSLIHDDLPCMDNDDQRRGRLTSHKKFGETTAVLAGDCLQAEAFRAVCEAHIGEAERFRCCMLLSQAAGISGICGGQVMDLRRRDSETALLTVDRGKTASLMAAACAMGAASAGSETSCIKTAWNFGTALGMAFQCRDDLLDRDGIYPLAGKKRCSELTEYYTCQALEMLDRFPRADFLKEWTCVLAGRTS